VHRRHEAVTSGVIVEVEAYIGESDPACHAASGRTHRNAPLYGPPGRAYVYLNYGIHCLVNVVTEAQDSPAAVLLRALEPLDGVPAMRRRRARQMKGRRRLDASDLKTEGLCRGPGNLTMAMGITLEENTVDLEGERLFIEERGLAPGPVMWGPRIGIRVGTDRPWRAYVLNHPSVSR
jgi:DNA-3-methyladenine glycosylase